MDDMTFDQPDRSKRFDAHLAALQKEIDVLPPKEQERLNQLVAETKKRRDEIETSRVQIIDAMATLKVQIKYLVFDLQATRDEAQTYKNRLKNLGHDPDLER